MRNETLYRSLIFFSINLHLINGANGGKRKRSPGYLLTTHRFAQFRCAFFHVRLVGGTVRRHASRPNRQAVRISHRMHISNQLCCLARVRRGITFNHARIYDTSNVHRERTDEGDKQKLTTADGSHQSN